ncbi:MAG TPA: hypothetical protein VF300_04265 [Methanothrix sp.]
MGFSGLWKAEPPAGDEVEIKDAVLRTRGIIKLDPETARAIADGDEFSVLVG